MLCGPFPLFLLIIKSVLTLRSFEFTPQSAMIKQLPPIIIRPCGQSSPINIIIMSCIISLLIVIFQSALIYIDVPVLLSVVVKQVLTLKSVKFTPHSAMIRQFMIILLHDLAANQALKHYCYIPIFTIYMFIVLGTSPTLFLVIKSASSLHRIWP